MKPKSTLERIKEAAPYETLRSDLSYAALYVPDHDVRKSPSNPRIRYQLYVEDGCKKIMIGITLPEHPVLPPNQLGHDILLGINADDAEDFTRDDYDTMMEGACHYLGSNIEGMSKIPSDQDFIEKLKKDFQDIQN